MNQASALAERPHPSIDIARLVYALSALAGHEMGDITKRHVLLRVLDLMNFERHLVLVQTCGVSELPQHQDGGVLVRIHDGLLHVLVDGRLLGNHPTGTHIDTGIVSVLQFQRTHI